MAPQGEGLLKGASVEKESARGVNTVKAAQREVVIKAASLTAEMPGGLSKARA